MNRARIPINQDYAKSQAALEVARGVLRAMLKYEHSGYVHSGYAYRDERFKVMHYVGIARTHRLMAMKYGSRFPSDSPSMSPVVDLVLQWHKTKTKQERQNSKTMLFATMYGG